MRSRCRVFGWVTRSSSSFRLAGSAHCRSSRKSASGCSCVANAPTNVAKHPAKPVLGLAERQLRHRRLRADDQLDLRDQVDDELAVVPQRRLEALPPGRDAVLALGQDLEHELAERLDDGEVGDVALVLLELAGDEDAPLARRSAGAARAPATTCRCPSSRRPAPAPARRWRPRARTPPARRRDSASGRRASAGSGSGRRRRARRAGRARSARSRATARRQRSRSCARPRGALVALLGHLGEQLEHDVREHGGDRRTQRFGRRAACARRGSAPTRWRRWPRRAAAR